MIIRPLPEKAQAAIGYTILAVCSPFWVPMVGGLWLTVKLDQITRPSRHFKRWFAWRPITTDHGFGETIWLEWVERATWYGRTIYRRPGDLNVHEQGPEAFR